MTFIKRGNQSRFSQLASIARAEPIGSIGYLTHTGLLAVASLFSAYVFGTWGLTLVVACYLAVLTLEKWAADRAVKTSRLSLYWPVLGLLFARTAIYNMAVVYVWSMDGDVFKFGVAALLTVATINIFVYHATHFEIIVAAFTPVWLGSMAITALSFIELGVTSESLMFLLISVFMVPYFLLAIKSVHEQWTRYDIVQQSLNHTQKLDSLGQLVAGVAHDFNNILTVTRGNAELLGDSMDDSHRPMIKEIIKASDRGSTLANQLLAFGRRTTLLPEPLQIVDFLSQSEAMLKRVIPENISLSFSTPSHLPLVHVDRHQLETAIVNLAINAKDALPNGGRIDIRAQKIVLNDRDLAIGNTRLHQGEYVLISVADDGIGISQADQEKIFDPFFTTKPEGKGSGLGLAMVVGFAEQSKGGVRMESEVGFGTRVTLYLPAMKDHHIKNPDQSGKT